MIDLSVTILEIFAVETFTTLTVRIGYGQMQICQSKGHI